MFSHQLGQSMSWVCHDGLPRLPKIVYLESVVESKGFLPKIVYLESASGAKGYQKLVSIFGSYPELLAWVMALLSFLGNVGDTRGCEHPFMYSA